MPIRRDIKRFTEKFREEHAELVRKTAVKVHQGVVSRTPVDTGRARAAWNLSWTFPDLGVPPEAAAVPEPTVTLPEAPTDFPVAYVTNNVDYIEFLETGSSAQAPLGMVAVTIAEVEASL